MSEDLTPSPPIDVAGQIVAADPTQSVWVSANAGTGKTRVLINRILRLLLAGVRPERILCLTFTKAAATEMASRLNEKLGDWAVANDKALQEDLDRLLDRRAGEDAIRSARRLFAETLDTPDGLKIRTIHSFCESLLGRFPVEAGIAPHFRVIDERAAAELRREARDYLMIRAAAEDETLRRAFDHLAGLVDEDRFAQIMGSLDFNRRRLQALARRHGSLEGILLAMRDRLTLEPGDTPQAIRENVEDCDLDALRSVSGILQQGSRTDQQRAGVIRDWVETAARNADLFDRYKSVFVTATGSPKAEKSLITVKLQEKHPHALGVLLCEQARVLMRLDRLKALNVVEATASLLRIGTALSEIYESLKKRRAYLDYDDLILRTSDLLSDGRTAWVHFKLDGGIDHILVDEAQDTSPEQWSVIRALSEDFFSGLGAHDDQRTPPRTMFAVGDQKQSIYSFQGADPAEFANMQTYFAARARQVERAWKDVELSLSFRSVWTILNTVDKVFEPPGARDGLAHDDRPIRHQSSRAGQAGRIELWPALTPDDEPEDSPWDAPVDQLSRKSPVVRLAEKIAETIDGWLKRGDLLESAGRPVRGGDIMILVRTRGQFAEEMVRQLKQRNIPVAGADRMILLNQISVMDLISAGRFALLPDDDLNTATLLKSPFIGFDDDQLFDLCHGRTGSVWAALRHKRGDSTEFDRACGLLGELLRLADRSPPFEFFSWLLNVRRGRELLVGRLGPDAEDAIDEFMNLCLAFEREHPPSLEGYLDWLAAGETQIKRDLEHGGNQVRVMTVHGSKGLQSGIVFLPDTCGVPDGRQGSRIYWEKGSPTPLMFWPVVKDNEESLCRELDEFEKTEMLREYRRLLYVALTRAQDRIYVCGWETKRGRVDGCWYDLVENALSGLENARRIDLKDGTAALRLSSEQDAPPDRLDHASFAPPDEDARPDWIDRQPPTEPTPPNPLAPSRTDADEDVPVRSPLDTGDPRRFQRGLLIHKLLELLPGLAEAERSSAAERFLSLPVHALTSKARAEIRDETLGVLSDPDLKDLFGPDSRAEVPIVGTIDTTDGPRVISAQLDRLLVNDTDIMVIDYKTNRPPPLSPKDVSPSYLKQMAIYRRALQQIYPGRTVRAALLWTDTPHAMIIDNDVLDASAP